MSGQPASSCSRRAFVELLCLPFLAEAQKRNIRIEDDGMLAIGGAREFVLGLYQLPRTANPWQEARDAGFNLVNVPAKQEDLAKAAANKFHVWITLGAIHPARREQDEDRIRKIVTEFRGSPAILFWETEDEPAYQWKKMGPRVSPEVIAATSRFIKGLDPEHPLYLNHAPVNLVETLRQYNQGTDIVAADIYPVAPTGIREMYALWPDGRQGDFLNAYISQTGQYADKMRQVAGQGRPVILVLQAFAWENLRDEGRDPKMVLYPSRAQLRFMASQAIAHGVNGLIFWGLHTTPPEAPLWADLNAVAQELSGLRTELAARPARLAPHFTYHDTGHSLDRGIEWIAKPSSGGVVLIAVNADPNPVDVSFEGLESFRKFEVLSESRSGRLIEGRMREWFEPFGVHVYRLLS